MRKIEKEVYTIDELSEEAKQKAINHFRYNDDFHFIHGQHEVYYFMQENFEHFLDINVFYSGFYSQGNGAMFTFKDITPDLIRLILSKFEHDKRLDNIFIDSINKISCVHVGRYSHENSRQIYFDYTTTNKENIDNALNVIIDKFETEFEKYYVSLCRSIYKSLESIYNEVNSDEYIIEDIKANDYEFYEDGTLY